MRVGLFRIRRGGLALASAALLAVAAPAARAQHHPALPGQYCPSPLAPTPFQPYAPSPAPSPSVTPSPGSGATAPGQPGASADFGTSAQAAPQQADLSGFASAAGGGESVSLGQSSIAYLDSAIPATQFRIRYDAGYGMNSPDRAEYFYAKCGCFRTAPAPFTDPNAPGPPLPETNIDYQDIRGYLEYAVSERFSGFIDVPIRFLNPEVNDNTTGIGDINFGFKAAMIYTPDLVVTTQVRAYAPTGDAGRGLGTNHYSIEPSILLWSRLANNLYLEGQFGDWIPIDGTEFAGNTLYYGIGLSYFIVNRCNFRVAPVAEVFGWTVLDGFATRINGVNPIEDASGDTIINAKFGVRFGFGELNQPGALSNSSLYIGSGRALTGDIWYRDLFRVEYRLVF
ncbi:MAG: hypothetical protein IT429_02600 [Gemmataceae bacterium]|nr:hypothetical protein [Gemmataceae bacterium]